MNADKVNKIGEILRNPENRCRGELARTYENVPVHYTSTAACKYCLGGAFFKVDEATRAGQFYLMNDEFYKFVLSDVLGYRDAHYMQNIWDTVSDEEQDQIVERLLSYRDYE